MNRLFFGKLLMVLFLSGTITATAQTGSDEIPGDLTKYGQNPDFSLLQHKTKANSRSVKATDASASELPDHVNNAETIYFPPVINQDRGSCGSAADVYYQFTTETNSYRHADASLMTNRYPSHFTWLITYSGSDKQAMMRGNGVPNANVYGGFTYSKYFGSQDCTWDNFGWMQGYDKWYSAMFNRIIGWASFPISVQTEEGRNAVKHWIWNHNGDESYGSGGVCGIGVASGLTQGTIPNTPTNQAIGLVGKKCVAVWGKTYDHALSIVGYDDRIEFDLDSNGVYGEKDKDELGAWIIVNSWGNWANKGFIYCPYKFAGPWLPVKGEYFRPSVYYVRKDYRPLRTFKILMDFSKRSEICLSAGISTDTAATKPEQTVYFEHFRYAGDGNNDDVEAEMPMLGQWVDGIHREPMEFGYDLTDLSASYDRSKPLKYFFIIDSKSTATGTGNIYKCSLMDYEFDPEGIEIPFKINTVKILNGGKRTMISVIATGEQINKPLNLALQGETLTWQAPSSTSLHLEKYYIYCDNELIDSVGSDQLNYNIPSSEQAVYTIKAGYKCGNSTIQSDASNAVATYTILQEGNNVVYALNKTGFMVPNVTTNQLTNATIEFWLKPYTLTNYNQKIGSSWGTFLMHTTSNGALYFGWDTGGHRSENSSTVLTRNKWQHVALTISGNTMTLYINGQKKTTFSSSKYSGFPLAGGLTVGRESEGINGEMDEFRIWSTCRSQRDILANMRVDIVNPNLIPELLVYYKMDVVEAGGCKFLRDSAKGHHALLNETKTEQKVDGTFLTNIASANASFVLSNGPYYVGQPIQATAQATLNITDFSWDAPDAGANELKVQNPSFIFKKEGTFPITLTVSTADGKTANLTKEITIEPVPEVKPDFEITNSSLPAGDRFSFINHTNNECYTYTWTMLGADEEKVSSTNASAVYGSTGDYDVTLTAISPTGQQTSVTKHVNVRPALPSAQFNVHPSAVVKGDPVYLVDASRYDPTNWTWNITNGKKQYQIDGRNSSFTPTSPGYYDVTLTAGNDIGKDQTVMRKIFVVSNAESGNGLNFGGKGQLVKFANPFTAGTRNWTIEWWMNADKLENAFEFSSNDGQLNISTSASGAMGVSLNNKTSQSKDGFVIAGEWHHYAVVYSTGHISYYRDGELFDNPNTALGIKLLSFSDGFTLGSTTADMKSRIDEFRFWGSSFTIDKIQAYANQPITDVVAAETDNALLLYFDFNQDNGSPSDLSSKKIATQRTGFGPDGDAWSSSLGVFTLNFEEDNETTDVTSTYLTNYQRPFLRTSTSVNKGLPRFVELLTGTDQSTWIIKNAVTDVANNIVTGVHVDVSKRYDMVIESGWNGFASSLPDHSVYQTVTLPAGLYRFSVNLDTNNGDITPENANLVVAEGDTLPSLIKLGDALNSIQLNKGQSIQFALREPTEVSLGILANFSGNNGINISSFSLESIPYEQLNADGLTKIQELVNTDNSKGLTATPIPGGLKITTGTQQTVKIHSVSGATIFKGEIEGTRYFSLPRGSYIVNGKKVLLLK